MSGRHTVIRSLHDLGLAAWFGGSLAGAVAVNGAAAAAVAGEQQRPGQQLNGRAGRAGSCLRPAA